MSIGDPTSDFGCKFSTKRRNIRRTGTGKASTVAVSSVASYKEFNGFSGPTIKRRKQPMTFHSGVPMALQTLMSLRNGKDLITARRKWKDFTERLESRVLFSVSADTLMGGVLVPGTQWSYQYSGSINQTQTQTVGGTTNFGSVLATEINLSSPNETVYFGFNGAGYVAYGSAQSQSGTATTDVFTPPVVEIPATIVAGTPSVSTFTYTQTDTPPGTTTTSPEITNSLQLVSNTLQPITVPAGTFNAYEIIENQTSSSGFAVNDNWYAPGVGLIKATDGTGSNQFTQELTAFTMGSATSASGDVAASFVGTLPKTIVEATPLKLKGKLSFAAGTRLSPARRARQSCSRQILTPPTAS